MKNKPDGLFFNRDLCRSVTNPWIVAPNLRFGARSSAQRRFGMEEKMITNFEGLISKVKECSKKTVSVAVAEDDAVLEAVQAARDQGIADAILVGDEA